MSCCRFHTKVSLVYRSKTWPTGQWNLHLIKSQFSSLGRMKREYRYVVLWQRVVCYPCMHAWVTAAKLPGENGILGWFSCQLYSSSRHAQLIGCPNFKFRPQTLLILSTVISERAVTCGNKQITTISSWCSSSLKFYSCPRVHSSPLTRVTLGGMVFELFVHVWSNTICLTRWHLQYLHPTLGGTAHC